MVDVQCYRAGETQRGGIDENGDQACNDGQPEQRAQPGGDASEQDIEADDDQQYRPQADQEADIDALNVAQVGEQPDGADAQEYDRPED